MIRSEKIKYQGGTISFHTQGEGLPVVLIHGYLMSSQTWGELPKYLGKKYKLILPDLPGHGLSSSYPPIHTMEFMAESVKSILDHLQIQKASLIGHSMGGYVALAFSEIFPETLSAMMLLNTTPFPDSKSKLEMRDTVIRIIEKGKRKLFLAQALKELLPPMDDTNYAESVFSLADRQGSTSIISTTRGMKLRPDRSHILKTNNIPKRWIIGSNDLQFNSEELKLSAEIEGLAAPSLLETGHMSFLENVPAVVHEVLELLKQVR